MIPAITTAGQHVSIRAALRCSSGVGHSWIGHPALALVWLAVCFPASLELPFPYLPDGGSPACRTLEAAWGATLAVFAAAVWTGVWPPPPTCSPFTVSTLHLGPTLCGFRAHFVSSRAPPPHLPGLLSEGGSWQERKGIFESAGRIGRFLKQDMESTNHKGKD